MPQRHRVNSARRAAATSSYPGNLTERERQVVETLSEVGHRKVAAERLHMGLSTLNDHLRVIAIKAGSSNGLLIVAKYLRATLREAATA